MTYDEAITLIKTKESLGIMPGLTRIKALLKQMHNPQEKMKIIHVAGTNGKGTVAATVAKALTDNGYKTGLFTSPWVIDYREQIQINGKFITEEAIINCVEQYGKAVATEFEFLTAMMYRYFADEGVDYAVVECGMGGKGDATNVETHNLAVITALSFDHTDFFGPSLEAIAEEKSGILRKDCHCILFNKEFASVFKDKCSNLITEDFQDNTALVNAVLAYLHLPPVQECVSLPARMERLGNVLLDGGHNSAAAQRLAPLLHKEVAVIGMLRDKDAEGYLSQIAPHCKTIIAVDIPHPRALPAAELADIAEDYCDDVYVIENPKESLRFSNVSLICGSFFLAREVRNILLSL